MGDLQTPTGAAVVADQYPIKKVRFVKGRTYHRAKRPDGERWWDLLEAACGKTGYLERGFPLGAITPCRGCQKAVGAGEGQ